MTKDLLSGIAGNPLLTSLTAVAAILTGANAALSSIGIPRFCGDMAVAIVLGYTAWQWGLTIWRESRKVTLTPGFATHGQAPGSGLPRRLAKSAGVSVTVPILCVGLLLYNIVPAIEQLSNPRWVLCATFVVDCNGHWCVDFLDSRDRSISDTCFSPSDDTGYLYLAAPNWWTYRPKSVVRRCLGASSERVVLGPRVFDKLCDEVVRLK
jgi:hypothetical protein